VEKARRKDEAVYGGGALPSWEAPVEEEKSREPPV